MKAKARRILRSFGFFVLLELFALGHGQLVTAVVVFRFGVAFDPNEADIVLFQQGKEPLIRWTCGTRKEPGQATIFCSHCPGPPEVILHEMVLP